jgi:hypothetical protein
MQISLKKPTSSTRWIYPFPESHPEVAVEMKVLGRHELARIYDKHGIRPGAEDLLMGQSFGALEDLIKAQVLNWKGMSDDKDNPIPCTDKNKVAYLFDHQVTTEEGEATNIWNVCLEKFNAELEAESKN